jgi:SepF-like predicted cell division protein (DUF552 family)
MKISFYLKEIARKKDNTVIITRENVGSLVYDYPSYNNYDDYESSFVTCYDKTVLKPINHITPKFYTDDDIQNTENHEIIYPKVKKTKTIVRVKKAYKYVRVNKAYKYKNVMDVIHINTEVILI